MAGQHDIWKKRILLPLWIIQLIATVIFLGLSALALWAWNTVQDDVEDRYGAGPTDQADDLINASAAINFAFAIFTILMVFVEMVLFCTHRLSPVLNLVMQCIKSAIWTVYLILIIISAASSGGSGGGAVFLILVIFLTCIGLLAYGATQVHRKRKGTLQRGNYGAAAQNDPSRYEPSRYNQTSYTGGATTGNPFRDPSPAPPYNPTSTHPAYRPAGEAGEYYGGSYEMQHGTAK